MLRGIKFLWDIWLHWKILALVMRIMAMLIEFYERKDFVLNYGQQRSKERWPRKNNHSVAPFLHPIHGLDP